MSKGRYRVSFAYSDNETREWYFNDYHHAMHKYSSLILIQLHEIEHFVEVVFAEESADGTCYLPIFRSRNEHPIGIYESGHGEASWSDCIRDIIDMQGGNVSAVARKIGIDPSNLHAMIAHGRNSHPYRLPSLESLCKIAEAVGYHVGFIPDGAGCTYTFHDEKEHPRRKKKEA